MAEIKHFITKAAGVTKTNKDRKSRQAILKTCKVGEQLHLEPDEDDPADPNTIKVCRSNGQQLGQLDAKLAADFVSRTKKGWHYVAFIKELTGGENGQALGCNLLIMEAAAGVSDTDAQMYLAKEIQPLFAATSKAAKKSGALPAVKPKKAGCFSVILAVSVGIPGALYLAWRMIA